MKTTELICILATGGTFDKVYYDALSEYQIGEPQIPEMMSRAGVDEGDYIIESVLKKDSLDMTDADRTLLCERVAKGDAKRFLIVHGTDTMTDTAEALAKSGTAKGCTIVLTGAMQPARFKVSDAVFNAAFAYSATRLLPAGIYIAMHGRVFPAGKVRKNRDQGRFEQT